MLNRERLIFAIDIQTQSYKLLRWVGTAIDESRIPMCNAARHSDDPEAAIEWVSQNYSLFPQEMQPDRQSLREFASFFWTYITSSFKGSSLSAIVFTVSPLMKKRGGQPDSQPTDIG